MTAKSTIMSEVTTKAGSALSAYRIGLTHDAVERRKYWRETEKQDTSYRKQWTANSLADAQDIEAHFINKGMKGGVGGNLSPRQTVYVYIF